MTEQNGSSNGHSPLTREQILAVLDMQIEAVDVPEWGGVIYVRNLTAKARDRFERSRYKMHGKEVEIIHDNTRAALLSATLCDKDGTLLMQEGDIDALGDKNGAIMDRLFAIAQRLSGLRAQDVEARGKN